MNDEVILRLGINIFDLQRKTNRTAILEFMKIGGLELLDKTMIDHAEDLFLVDQIPPFKKSILSKWTNADGDSQSVSSGMEWYAQYVCNCTRGAESMSLE